MRRRQPFSQSLATHQNLRYITACWRPFLHEGNQTSLESRFQLPDLMRRRIINAIMKFLHHMRSPSKLKNCNPEAQVYSTDGGGIPNAPSQLSIRILERILTYICPHTQDESYSTSEESMIEDGCMLCDMRDLAHCALVSRSWAEATKNIL